MRWEWYTGEAFELKPYWRERYRYAAGVRLAERPPPTEDVVRYGFDDADRPVVMQEFSGFLSGRQTNETTWTHLRDVIEEVRMDAFDGKRGHLDRFEYADGLLRRYSKEARGGRRTEEYTYHDGLLSRIDVTEDGRPWARIAVTHDAAGLLERIETTCLQGRSTTEVTYRRPPPGFSLDGQCEVVAGMLVDRLPRLVATRTEVDGPFYCLGLSYFESCLPTWALGLESERQEWLAEDDADDILWNPAEFEQCDTDPVDEDDPDLHEAAELLDQEIGLSGERHRVRDLLLEVAYALNRHDWSELAVTPDFMVYPTHVDCHDTEENLAAVRRAAGR
ncbi:hypothetical protein [Catellatospora vulcania]|uniref:hypothetical protein n=1 Tax=Catellatospora vulcania TaxID=1460450 RepID=UPI0012D3764F|nr:hypothetical protein [Catellatospora vulcania]